MGLSDYWKKRKFGKTPEPKGEITKKKKELRFVVQKHHASRLHYDFRLELQGVLKSWAVPKGPSMNPSDKRLAMMVEDHPYSYRTFEGVIPKGNYGAGNVIVWDEGTYEPLHSGGERELLEGLKKGDLKFILHGSKLNGEFVLAKMKNAEENAWLLIKHHDVYANTENVTLQSESVISGREVDEPAAQITSHKKSKLPTEISPELAVLTEKPFDNKEWLFEIKWDGYRAIAQVEKGDVRLYSRNNQDFNNDYPAIVTSLQKISHTAVIDGEVVVVDKNGHAKFQLLQQYKNDKIGDLVYYVFDLLYLDGFDIRDQPLIERKRLLKDLIADLPHIQYSDHIEEKGTDFFKVIKQKNLEGMIAKKKNSSYVSKRTKDWLKVKHILEEEAIICGFTAPQGSREKFGALILGVYKNQKLTYVGHTGSGFSRDQLHELHELLDPLEVKESPFKDPPKPNAPVTWVKPKIVCQIKYGEMTQDGIMRQAIFLGLRKDKAVNEVVSEEKAAMPEHVTVTHGDKVYWPEDGYTKQDMIDYYQTVAPCMMPHLKDRLQSLNRHPNGIHGESFFQKNIADAPDWIKTIPLEHSSDKKITHYMVCQKTDDLLYMANLGCIEMNPWNSRYQKLEYPDYLIMDLDPHDISFKETIKTAKQIKEILDDIKADSFIKTSGKHGLHIMIPLGAKYDYDQTKQFAEILAKIVYSKLPKVTSVVRDPRKRQKKIYVDFLQNRIGQTISAPYSLRPVKGAPVSTPIYWKELDTLKSSGQFTIETILPRIKKYGDIWEDLITHKGIDMLACLDRLSQ